MDQDVSPEFCSRFGDTRPEGWPGPVYIIQEHHASRLHYDLRLELDGTLKSWALPKEPPTDPATRRLAVQVEDHALGYASFEGEIPQGTYGAGKVKLWDRGTFEVQERTDDKLKIDIRGERLTGTYYLIRTRPWRSSSRSIRCPSASAKVSSLNSSGDPRPYMHETLATTITSLLVMSEPVALSRSLSMSSFIETSFSI